MGNQSLHRSVVTHYVAIPEKKRIRSADNPMQAQFYAFSFIDPKDQRPVETAETPSEVYGAKKPLVETHRNDCPVVQFG